MPDRETRRQRLSAGLSAGLCAACGQRPPAPAAKSCRACLDLQKTAEAARRTRLRRAGLCLDCASAPASAPGLRCPECAASQRARVAGAKA